MLLVDDRAGSCELTKPLLALDLPVEETRLEFADVAFLGRGVGGAPVLVGIEHKRLPDLIQSLQGRLPGHQLPGLVTHYDRAWLIVEGDWSHDASGRTTAFQSRGQRRPLRGAPSAMALEQRLITLETRGGLHIRHTATKKDSVRFIAALYRFWTDKDLDDHRSHLAMHSPDLDRTLQLPTSTFRRLVAQLPGVGYAVSKSIEDHFNGSFRRMMLAPEAEWAEILTLDGNGKARRLGASRAKQILEALK